jgi:hypothetical protein
MSQHTVRHCSHPCTLLLASGMFALAVKADETGAACMTLGCFGLFRRVVSWGQGVVAVVDCLGGRGRGMMAVLAVEHSTVYGVTLQCSCLCVFTPGVVWCGG